MQGIFGAQTPAPATDEPLRLLDRPGRVYRRAAGDSASHPLLAIAVALLVGIAAGLLISLWPSIARRIEQPASSAQQNPLTITDTPAPPRGGA